MPTIGQQRCPICGFRIAPVDFTICPSCGTEFGIDTLDHTSQELRDIWISNGPRWESTVDDPPDNWNPWQQLVAAGLSYAIPFYVGVQLKGPEGVRQIPNSGLVFA
jgi:hypothetical protein